MKKITFPVALAIIIVIVMVSGVIYLYRKGGSESGIPKEIITELKDSLNEEFSAPEEAVFSWTMRPKIEGEEDVVANEEEVATEDLVEVDISGWKIVATDIASDSDVYELVDEYFQTNDFEIDGYNWGASTVSGVEGFQKNNVVCLVNMYVNMEETEDPKVVVDMENATSTMEISCGLL